MARYLVAIADEIPPGSRLVVNIAGRSIGVFNVDGHYYALRNRCPHQGGPLCAGDLLGLVESDGPGHYNYVAGRKFLQCPWHGWEFDLENGQSWFDPAKTRVRPYRVALERESQLEDVIDPQTGRAKGPYTAETYSIGVERDCIVIEVGN